jgi:tetratricopeptide (TPR) repeat protein
MNAILSAMALMAVEAEPIDANLVRKTIWLPDIQQMVVFVTADALVIPDADAFAADEIPAVEAMARDNPSNADCYWKLASLYQKAGNRAKADVAYSKAEELYQARLSTNPEDGLSRARLAAISNRGVPRNELRREFRQAVMNSPREWECRELQFNYLTVQVEEVFSSPGSRSICGPRYHGIRQFQVNNKVFGAAALRDRLSLLDEAIEGLDQAAKLFPKNPKVLVDRMAGAWLRVALSDAIQHAQGEFPDADESYRASRKLLSDIWTAAALAPNNARIIGGAACCELIFALKFEKNRPKSLDEVPGLSAEKRKSITDVVYRLRQLSDNADLQTATDGAESLAEIDCLCGGAFGAEECLARLVQRRPSLRGAWDLRRSLLIRQKSRRNELIALCAERLKYDDSARNRYFLAEAYARARRTAEARKTLDEALAKEPDNFDCTLGLAAVLMLTGDAADLDRAGRLLKLCNLYVRNQPTRDEAINYAVLQGAYYALRDQVDELRELVSSIKEGGVSDERLDEFEKIVGPDILLAPPPGIPIQPVSGTRK